MKIKLIIFLFISVSLLFSAMTERTITDLELGTYLEKGTSVESNHESASAVINSRDERVDLNWQTSHPTSICGDALVSGETGQSFVRWETNELRVSLFENSAIPEWEHYITEAEFEYPMSMTETGEILAVGDGTALKVFTPDSSVPFETITVGGSIVDMEISQDGNSAYVCFTSGMTSYVQKYNIPDAEMVWENDYEGGAGNLVLSEDNSKLIFTQYGGGIDNMFVLLAETGDQIFQAPEYNQNPPAMSWDGTTIVNGDYSGYIWVYEYDEDEETYHELWNYHVSGGGSSDWIGGMAVSNDGNTIAVGTLTFLTNGYNGQIYLFDKEIPVPLWVYENCGDYVVDVDLSGDGSVLAACGYGPYSGGGADFMLFRRSSNIPVFTIDSPGSLFGVDLADDGSFCTVGGKAVHAREMGSGGTLYCVDCDLGGGDLSGIVTLPDNEDNSGVHITLQGLEGYHAYSDGFGVYEITHIPAGLYTVEYSKTGYETYICYDGLVLEGEETVLEEVSLNPYGDAPVNLSASQDAGIFVELSWEAPAGQEPGGYFVYRKRYMAQEFPEEPLGSVFFEESYCDETALAGIKYYYAVTAITDNGEQSPYSNTARGWSSTGFIADYLSVYEGDAPIIDGQISEGEWDDAYCFDASDFWGSYDSTAQPVGSVMGYFKMNEEHTELYCAFENHNDTELEDHDEVALYIDDNGDGVFPAVGDDSEGNYWAAWYTAGVELKFRPIYSTGGVGDVIYLDDPVMEASVASGHVVYEFILPIGDEPWQINPGVDNSSNLGIFVLDDNAPDPHGFDGWWPHDNIDLFDPAGFGTIIYGGEAQVPPVPQNAEYQEISETLIRLFWEMPEMNDFANFNIYLSEDEGEFERFGTTEGTNFDIDLTEFSGSTIRFYVTTLSNAGLESDASIIMEYTVSGTQVEEVAEINGILGIYPNPFNPSTKISFNLAEEKLTKITVYNIRGQRVKRLLDDVITSGTHEIIWNGQNDKRQSVASGVYFVIMESGDVCDNKRILLLK